MFVRPSSTQVLRNELLVRFVVEGNSDASRDRVGRRLREFRRQGRLFSVIILIVKRNGRVVSRQVRRFPNRPPAILVIETRDVTAVVV